MPKPAPPRDSGNGWLLLILLVVAALSGGGTGAATTPPPSNPHYVTPSCTGIASVPGYKNCHK